MSNVSPLVQFKSVNVSASFGNNNLLSNISLSLFQGERLVIIGPSGAGKTTLLRLLNCLINPSQGSLYFTGEEYQNIPVISLRKKIVLVPQEPKLLGMTVAESLAYPLVLQQLKKTEIRQRIDYWYKELRLEEDWLDRNELQLSLGQRQIVSIARALIMEPEILLLDEPTSALDIGRASHLLETLTNLTNNHLITVIMVNHQLELAKQFASRVLYLDAGKIIEDIPGKDLDWQKLQENLIYTNKKNSQEWDDNPLRG